MGPQAEAPLVRAARRGGVRDERVLAAIAAVPRAGFVPDASVHAADADVPVPIAHDQVTTQPSLVARMVEALELAGDERVLEVGTGLGWQTALLAGLAREVWSVERWEDLAATARRNLAAAQVGNALVVVGDGSLGVPRASPFDAIVVSAAFPQVPPPLAAQLAAEGRLVQPVGPGGREEVVLFERTPAGLRRRHVVCAAHFVRLFGEHGFPAPG